MFFDKNDGKANDRIIYKTKPNMLFGCKKAILGVVLLIIILFLSSSVIQFIGEMQVYLISSIKLPITRYAAIAFFVIIFINIIYIIWQLIGWYSTEYTLTDFKIIVKTGVISTKKNYMPYTTVQDLNTSQSIFAKIFNVGSVFIFSAYDNNQMELKNIYNPSEVEDIIFSKIMNLRAGQTPPQRFPQNPHPEQYDYYSEEEYYDEFEPITPIVQENHHPKRNYDYYPEENFVHNSPKHKYEYEPYHGYRPSKDNYSHDTYSKDNYYDEVRDEYSYVGDDYYQDNDTEIYYNDGVDEFTESEEEYMDDSHDVIRRHFDKFKR